MFGRLDSSPLAQRARVALRLTRSFLLLEDDSHVDWEVDRSGRAMPAHPHRAALRARARDRRPGSVAPAQQACLCPVRGRRCLQDQRAVTRYFVLSAHFEATASDPCCL